jgi:hypothetical protein
MLSRLLLIALHTILIGPVNLFQARLLLVIRPKR